MNPQYSNLSEQYSGKEEGYYEIERREMLPFIPEGVSTVLEVGCSSGAFGRLIKSSRPDIEVWGIEPNDSAAKIAAERIDRVIHGTFEAQMPELNGKTFDCIVFNDVLEHMVNPQNLLMTSRDYLSQNGWVVASIPNVLHFYNIWKVVREQDWKYEDSGIMDNTHLRFFSKKSILRMFHDCKFSVKNIVGINASYGIKFRIANLISLGHISDLRYVQFAIQAILTK